MMKLRAAARAVLAGPRNAGRRLRTLRFAALALVIVIVVSACTGGLASEEGWSAPVVVDGTLYVGNRDGQLLSFEANRLPNGFRAGAIPVDLDEPEALPEHARALVARFQATDDESEDSQGFYASPLIVGDSLVIGGLDGKLYALSRNDVTEQLWLPPFRTRGGAGSNFEVDEGRIFSTADVEGDLVFVADDQGFVYAVNLADGRQVWDRPFEAGERFWSGPTVADGVVYIGNMDHSLYALDAATGRLIWEFDAADGAFVSKPLVVNDTIYIGAFDNTFYAINRADGTLKHKLDGDNWFWNDALHVDGTIFVGTLGHEFFALNADDLSVKWSIEMSAAVRSQAASYQDVLFIAARNGEIVTVDLETGSIVEPRIPPIGKKVLASLVVADGVLYVRDDDQRLHSFELDG